MRNGIVRLDLSGLQYDKHEPLTLDIAASIVCHCPLFTFAINVTSVCYWQYYHMIR